MTRITALPLALVGVLAVIAVGVATAVAVPVGGTATAAPATVIRIWTDRDHKVAVEQVAGQWASEKKRTVEVVEKDFAKIRDELATVPAESAPDVVIGAHDWTGQLVAAGLVLPLNPTRSTRRQFPPNTLSAFSFGTAVKRLYGAPVALENIGLVVNTKLATVPTTFESLRTQALAFKRKAPGNLAIAVPQGAAGDAYHMYPFFSGLGGYVFGQTKVGNVDPSDVGVANRRFLSNAAQIDSWNSSGLIDSKIDYGVAKDSFLKGKAVFWITGPWEADALRQSRLQYRIVRIPAIEFRSVPFISVQGFMVTKYAAAHGVESGAKNLVTRYLMRPASQTALAAANHRIPANKAARSAVADTVLKQFGAAGAGGVPMPNIPQMSLVWSDLSGAWAKSTKGPGATKARIAFSRAARNIANRIG